MRPTGCLSTLILTVLTAAAFAGAAKAEPPLLVPASIPPDEIRRSIYEFTARAMQPEAAEMIFVFSCLTDMVEARFDSAQRDCSEAIGHEPDNPGPYKLRGEASLFQGRYEHALEDLNYAIALDSTDAESYAARGQAFRLMRQYPRAVADFDKAIAIAPQNPAYWNGRCWIRAEMGKRLALALRDCTKAQHLTPQFAAAFDSRGLVHLRLRRYARAIQDYTRAISLRPEFATSFFGRGLARLHLNRIADGRRDIRQARRIDPDIDDFYARMGVTGHGLAMPPGKRAKPRRDRQQAIPKDQFARR